MFDWTLFAILVLITLPGYAVTLPRLLTQLEALSADKLPAEKERPSRPIMLAAGMVQYLLFSAAAAAVGVLLTPRVGLSAPFFAALAAGSWSWSAVSAQIWPALLLGSGGALIFVAAYYGFFRPRFDAHTRRHSEKLRNELGMAGRLLYGGIVEEVLTRWGLMTLLVWLGAVLFGGPTTAVMWGAIVVTGILFGLGHLPSYAAINGRPTPFFLGYMILMNLWASLIFGWLFWQHGLLAAMVAHMLFHLLWWPFDRFYYRPEPAAVELPQIG